jgi:tetratricopeptide (TPR) repeat protein
MECPNCDLINHSSAKRCDCGFDFSSDSDTIQTILEARTNNWKNYMIFGGIAFFIGLLITLVSFSYTAQSLTGGRSFVAYGAILGGMAAFFKGYTEWRRFMRKIQRAPEKDPREEGIHREVEVVNNLLALAELYKDQGKYTDAERIYKQALEKGEKAVDHYNKIDSDKKAEKLNVQIKKIQLMIADMRKQK